MKKQEIDADKWTLTPPSGTEHREKGETESLVSLVDPKNQVVFGGD